MRRYSLLRVEEKLYDLHANVSPFVFFTALVLFPLAKDLGGIEFLTN